MKVLNNKEKIYSLATIFLIIDQFIKILIRSKLQLHKELIIIPHFFSLYNTVNTGAAFSLFSNHTSILVIFTLVILFIIDKYLQKEKNFTKLSRISLSMILGGMLGNLIDRIVFHGVTDYLLFVFNNWAFPVFNLADVLITCGVFLYFIYALLDIINDFKTAKISKNATIKKEKGD